MRYPYERFINFLITRRVDVSDTLERIELPPVGDMGIADRKERIRATAPAAILRYLKQPPNDLRLSFREGILGWAEDQGFRCLWERQREFGRKILPELEEASNLFLNPHSRTAMGTLLLANAPLEEIREVIQEQFDIDVTRDVSSCFTHLFWDVSAMGRRGWDEFVPLLADEQRSVLSLGVQGVKPDGIRYAIGAETPSNPKQVLKDILTHAHHQFKRAMASANPTSAGVFQWADLATKVAREMGNARIGGGGSDDDPMVRSTTSNMFSVIVEPPRIMTLDDLEGEVSKTKTALDRAMEENARDA